METFATKEFLEKLETDSIEPFLKLVGWVKKSSSRSEVLFAFKTDFLHWIKVHESKIESVHILRRIPFEEQSLILVKLQFKKTVDPETKTLSELLSALENRLMDNFIRANNFKAGIPFYKYLLPNVSRAF